MLDTGMSRAALGGALSFVVVLLILAATVGRSVPETASAGQMEVGEDRPAPTTSKDTLGPSIEEAREMIVGVWIQDLNVKDRSIDTPKKGPKKWVFTEDGTLKKYRRTDAGTYKLEETVQYALVDKIPGLDQKASEAANFVAYLRNTPANGEVKYNVLGNINREANPPYMFVQFTGGASISSTHFKPPSAFK